ncbi:MAG: queuosine salvage family protein [Candidatus Doudnabacteria bacterium]|nr:queuosine salvage family protein [Candidatus Doudnabacteria bacterium]
MSIKDTILNSLKPVLENSKFVGINQDNIIKLAGKIKDYPLPAWDNTLQLSSDPKQTAQYYFFLDSINFCFWAEKGKERWSFLKDGEWLQGYYAYSYAIKKAFEANPNFSMAEFLAKLSFEDFKKIFEGKNQLLLLEERHKIITENFRILAEKFNGEAANLIQLADNDVNKLVYILLENFPTFQDWVLKGNSKIYFLKRAQIFISDLYYAFEGKGLGQFINMKDLTIFADYKLPQLLQAEGALEYQGELLSKIKNEVLIESGSQEEIEIRANTIYASELLRQELERIGRKLTSNELDWILWVQAKSTEFLLPFHKTLTINY